MKNGMFSFYFILLILACMALPYFQEVFAITESKPIIVALVRGDVEDKKSLSKLFQKYLTSDDYILPILSDDWNYIEDVPGNRMISAGTLSELESKIQKFTGKVNWAVYDLEPGSPPEELDDYVNSVKKAYELAHKNNMNLLLTPAFQDIKKYDSQFAPYVDMVNLQIPHFVKDYPSAVNTAVNNIKEINPNALVTIQLIPREGAEKINGNPDEIIKTWDLVKDKVDGVLVFYYKDPNPVPILDKFYSNLGRNINPVPLDSKIINQSELSQILLEFIMIDSSISQEQIDELETKFQEKYGDLSDEKIMSIKMKFKDNVSTITSLLSNVQKTEIKTRYVEMKLLQDGLNQPILTDNEKQELKTEFIENAKSPELLWVLPKQQLAAGIDPGKIICIEGHVPVIKTANGMPICVKVDTAIKMIEKDLAVPLA